MKRDMDLIRTIALHIEEQPITGQPHLVKIDGRADEEVAYHLDLMQQSSLITVPKNTATIGLNEPDLYVYGLTNAGHDFSEKARSNTRWEAAKRAVLKGSGILENRDRMGYFALR